MEKEKLMSYKNEAEKSPDNPESGKPEITKPPVFKKYLKNKFLLVALGLLILGIGVYLLGPKIFKPKPKQIYQVAVVVRSQQTSDPAEDLRSSLKAGDVLVTQLGEHSWSSTELISYLILKMNLTEEQAQKLTQPEEREMKKSEISEEEKQRQEEEKKRAKKEGREYREEPRRVTLRARAYGINLEKLGFTDPNALYSGQPFLDQIFEWDIVDKKPSAE